ncbi:MAG TPA: 4-(cytidine 5'-diphospho)-2-C-methyl-D-erythritol kinase [Bacteroidales bacterium]|nr:4-(cytidine 5'-diphospho)-2-C-methyl-D-erythritol kinase [Bacteroidales bacterium]HRZ48577.1 4-(cytidine 5'-diphospho)-2-C-methyl-D-erythritol kinase [Bacteroidales bacterium]
MIVFPNAKINLGLFVTGKRADGYHNLETIMVPVPVYDILEVSAHAPDGFEFRSTGLAIQGSEDANLCVKAYRLMASGFGIRPVKIHLHKQIPAGSGMGGGSADGAFTLTALNRLFNCGLTAEDLEALALELGSDCPFFIRNRPVVATGRGELMEPVDNPIYGSYLIIAKPHFSISTAEAFRLIDPASPVLPLRGIPYLSADRWPVFLRNDFERVALKMHPEATRILQDFYASGAWYASMTGSGSAFFGLFRTPPEAMPDELKDIILFAGLIG